jgi:hypothetical protein
VLQSTHADYAGYSCAGTVPGHPVYGDSSYCRNISFDGSGNPISVNAAFFEHPDIAPGFTLPMAGTGYTDNCWYWCSGCNGSSGPTCTVPSPCRSDLIGSTTGWLTTTANVVPGETLRLMLVIYDEADSIFDSRVIIDNFRWGFSSVSGPVTTK